MSQRVITRDTADTSLRSLTGDEARALRERMLVVRDDPECWDDNEVAVYSASNRYVVNPVLGWCSCPSNQYHDGACKHRERAAYELGCKEIPAWVDRDRVDPVLLERVDGGDGS